jgi:hypothetical protein
MWNAKNSLEKLKNIKYRSIMDVFFLKDLGPFHLDDLSTENFIIIYYIIPNNRVIYIERKQTPSKEYYSLLHRFSAQEIIKDSETRMTTLDIESLEPSEDVFLHLSKTGDLLMEQVERINKYWNVDFCDLQDASRTAGIPLESQRLKSYSTSKKPFYERYGFSRILENGRDIGAIEEEIVKKIIDRWKSGKKNKTLLEYLEFIMKSQQYSEFYQDYGIPAAELWELHVVYLRKWYKKPYEIRYNPQ